MKNMNEIKSELGFSALNTDGSEEHDIKDLNEMPWDRENIVMQYKTHIIIYIEDNDIPLMKNNISKQILNKETSWNDLINGFNKNMKEENISEFIDEKDIDFEKKSILDYIDTNETESLLISNSYENIFTNKRYTHLEIHPSLMFGVMGNQIIFPENNQFPRDLFSCGQSKQAVSLYHSNHNVRIDKTWILYFVKNLPIETKNAFTDVILPSFDK